jgi:hypothetical protein
MYRHNQSTAGTFCSPPVISAAQNRLLRFRTYGKDAERELPVPEKSQADVLEALIFCADARSPSAEIRVRQSVLADLTNLCTRTVQRALAWLHEAGWITRGAQVMCRSMGFQIVPVEFTKAALALLFPAGSDKMSHAKIDSYLNKKTRHPAAPELSGNIGPSTHSEHDEPQITGTVNSNSESPQAEPDLQALVHAGLNLQTVNWLKGEASARGKRLGDIVQCIDLNKPRNLKAYLRRCITSSTDFAARLTGVQRKREELHRIEAEKRAFDDWKAAFKGQFTDQHGRSHRRNGDYLETLRNGFVVGSVPLVAAYRDIKAGRLSLRVCPEGDSSVVLVAGSRSEAKQKGASRATIEAHLSLLRNRFKPSLFATAKSW